MKHVAGYHRTAALPEERKNGGGEGYGDRFLILFGILTVTLSLALPLAKDAEKASPQRIPDDAALVMSTAVIDGEEDPTEQTAASPEDSVFDEIGRFFARWITGG